MEDLSSYLLGKKWCNELRSSRGKDKNEEYRDRLYHIYIFIIKAHMYQYIDSLDLQREQSLR
jgi:hypothetical protein